MSDEVSSQHIVDHADEMILTEVPPGTHCKLIGIKRRFPGKHFRSRKFGKSFRDRFEEHKSKHGHFGHRHGSRKGCRHREIMKRLLDLGITKGCTFQVVQGSQEGPVLVQVRGTRIALGHGLASRILVQEVK